MNSEIESIDNTILLPGVAPIGTVDSVILIATLDQSMDSTMTPRLVRASINVFLVVFNVFARITSGLGPN